MGNRGGWGGGAKTSIYLLYLPNRCELNPKIHDDDAQIEASLVS